MSDKKQAEMAMKFMEQYEKEGYLKQQSLADALLEWSEKYKENIAVVDCNTSWTYSELYDASNNLAQGLLKQGIKKGDNVLVQLPNSVYFVQLCFALFIVGARPILLLPAHREKDILNISSLVEPVAMVIPNATYGTDYQQIAENIAHSCETLNFIITDTDTEKYVSIERLEREARMNVNGYMAHQADYRDIALFLLSGGTTGVPKVIPKLHTAYLYNAEAAATHCHVTEDSVYLAVLSIAHDYPLCSPGVLGTLAKGGKVVLGHSSTFEEALDWIQNERVTFTSLVPVIADLWIEALAYEKNADLSSIQYILCGAAKLEKGLAMQLIEKFECQIIQGYGLGEGITCFTSPKDSLETILTCQGKPISTGDEIRIVNAKGENVPTGEAGELIQRGPYTFLGYYRAPELNVNSFTEDGYFRTGDKARLTKEGDIQILGRIKEQINRAGENVIPSEVESYIREYGSIREVVVAGVPDEELGERTCAFLVANGEKISLGTLREFLIADGVAQYKLPDQLIYVDSIPYINVGKPDKKKLITEYIG